MSIQGKVTELNSLKNELKTLTQKCSNIRKRCKVIEEEIDDYLEQKDQPGLKYNGMAIIRETKTKRPIKPKVDIRESAISILENAGVDNPEKIYEELIESRLGSPKQTRKLKINKIKPEKL
jgi:hypothetical protein